MSNTFTLRQLTLSLVFGLAWNATVLAADNVITLTPVVVTGQSEGGALQPSVKQERTRLNTVPGGTNLIQPQKEIRLTTLRDALDFQPGLVVQDFFGGIDQPRLNIRGSGILLIKSLFLQKTMAQNLLLP